MSTKMGIDVRSSFSASADNLFYMGISQPTTNPSNVRTPTVTDMCPNKTFHVEQVDVPKASVQSAGVENFDSSGVRANVEAVKNDYMGTDAQIKNYVTDVAKHMFGANVGNSMMKQILPEAPLTHKQAAGNLAMQAMDPLQGGTAVLASVATAVTGEMGKFKDPEIIAKLDEMLTKIREAGSQQRDNMLGVHHDSDFPKPPDGIDFDSITAEELFNFLKRDVGNDPVMQQIEKIEVALDEYDRNMQYREAHDHEVVTAAKLEVASEAELAEMAGSEAEIQEFVAECSPNDMEYGAGAVDMVCSGLVAPGHLAFTAPEFASQTEAKFVISELHGADAPANNGLEGSLRAAATAFKPNESSMMG